MRLSIRALLSLVFVAAVLVAASRVGPASLGPRANPGSPTPVEETSLQAAVREPAELSHPLVVTQVRPHNPLAGCLPGGVLQPDTCEGGQVIVFYPDHRRLNLSAGFHSACDPEVSYDGQRILFAAKKTAVDNWNVYETGSDGSGLRQVTKGLGDCRNPLYLSTLYTLISDKPWHQIAFVSNMTKIAGEYGPWPVTGIYSSRIDGTGLMRLTHDPSGDSDPFQMSDGRLLFSGWRPRLPDRPARLPLYAVNIDGTDFMLFADSEGLKYKRMPCVTTRRLAVFVESEQLRPDGAGYLACVTLRRNLHSYKRLTKPGEGLFRSPSPMPDGRILVSRKPEDRQGRFGICVYDPDSGSVLPVFDDPKFDEIQAKILAPRAEPDGRSTSVLRRTGEIEDPHALERQDRKSGPRELPSGRLYCINVYNSDFIAPAALKRGTVRRVRVLEGLLPPAAASPSRGGAAVSTGGAGSPATEGALLLRRRFVGEAPVEEDGSFNLHVPANIPLELQILDADGLSLASCSWIWVKNNEPRGCIGCHEDQELVPENRLVTAVAKPSLELVLPPERRRSVDFLHDVEPIIRSRCVSCHNTGGTTPWLDESPDPAGTSSGDHPDGPYERLLDYRQEENVGKVPGWRYVTAGRARTSPLIWHIFGRNTSQPWDPPLPAGAFRPMPPLNGGMLSEDERRTFVEWIDTGAQWDSRSSRNGTVTRQNSRDTAKP